MTSIAEERAGLAAVGWRLRHREEWGARRAYTDTRTVTEPATRVFVHITITNPGNYANDDAHARAVEAIGIARFPNTGISYNRLIFQSGTASEGQPLGRRGAHTVNDKEIGKCVTTGCPGRGAPLTAPSWNLNINSRAYAICQNVDNIVTDAQLDALARAIAGDKLAGFVHLNAEIHGHRCAAWKSCPAELMWDRMAQLDALVAHYVRNGLEPVPKPEPPPEDDDMGNTLATYYGSTWGYVFNWQSRTAAGMSRAGVEQAAKGLGVPVVALPNTDVKLILDAFAAPHLLDDVDTPAAEEPPA